MTKENLSLNTRVTLTPAFSTEHIQLKESELHLKLVFKEGEHTFVSPPVAVGETKTGKIYATLSLWYHLDLENQTLSISANDVMNERAPFLELKHEKEDHSSRQFAHTVRKVQTSKSKVWTHESNLYGALPEVLNQALCKINDEIIEKCKKLGFNLALGTRMPELEAGELDRYSAVYNKEGRFVELYDPTQTYPKEFTIQNLQSTWYGYVYFKSNENFANVIGSTGDPKIAGKSWIQLWRDQFGSADSCTSINYKGFHCNGTPLGGHVISGTKATQVPAGVNYVYIMPICSAHNNNNGVYMAAITYTKGVALHNYLQSS